MNDIAEQAKTISELTGNSKLANQIQKGQQIVHLAQNVMNKAETVAAKLNSGDILGSVSELLNSSSPTGLQFTLEALSLPATTFSVISFELREGYSEPYCLTVHLSSSLDAIDASQVLDQKVKFTVWQSGKVERVISGIVSSFTEGESGFEQTHYFLEIRPALWRSTLRRNSRLFQQKNLQQILTALLNEHDIPHYAFAFTDSHPAREFCVQWQETDFDFIQRLTAEEGIFYYFEEKEGIETLVFSDNAETLSSPLASPYNPNKTAQLQEQTVGQFLKRTQVRHSRAVLKDYTFKKPDWVAQFEQSATEGEGQRQGYEHYDYPGRFKGSEQGKAFTRYRLESLRRDAHLGEGESNIPGLSPGRLLTLSQHPNPEFNTTWQVIGVVSRGEQPQSVEGEAGEKGTYFTNHFQVIPRYQTWRPLQRTKPKVDGPQIAQVVGPKGEEIFTDNVGRVRVQFFWDREGKYDDHSSCWIRVSQAWAGQGWGVLAIPRVGQEVLVDFLDGDPDQPIITGRTYHTRNVPPGALPQSKTQMALRSKTYKGEGYNELLFEDAPGQEQLNLHAQRDMNTVVLNDRTTQVGNNHREKIGEEQHIEVHQNRQKTVGGVERQKIGQNKIEYVKGDYLHFSNLETLLSSAEGDIIFETAGGKVTLTKDGKVTLLAKVILVNGKLIKINCGAEKLDVKSMVLSGSGNDNNQLNSTGFPNTASGECIPCKAAAAMGRPVNPILGIKLLIDEVDFAFSGLLPLVWTRSYYSDQKGIGWLGQGWSVPGCQRIERQSRGFVYIDEQGREIVLPELSAGGGLVYLQTEQIWCHLNEQSEITISSQDKRLSFTFRSLDNHYQHFVLSTIKDAVGNQQQFIYTLETGLPYQVIDGNGRIFYLNFANLSDENRPPLWRLISVAWDNAGEITSLVNYRYNPEGDLIAVITPQGKVVREFAYRNHIMIMHGNASGLISQYEYDDYTPQGKVLRNYTNLGENWQFSYNPTFTKVIDNLGREEEYHFDSHHELLKRTFADGSTVKMERNSLGQLLSQTDSAGRTTAYRYNELGQITQISIGEQKQLFEYNDKGYLIAQIDALGHRQEYGYDGVGNLVMSRNAEEETRHFVYNEKGLQTAVIDPLGNRTELRYNADNQLSAYSDCSGNTTLFDYNERGLLKTITDAEGHQTHYRYNAQFQLIETIYAEGSTEQFEYDQAGRLQTYIDGKGNRTTYRYSLDDLPLERINALNHRFRYDYDKARRLIQLTNENQATYHFHYDVMNRLTTEVGVDNRKTTYHYNKRGELIEKQEFNPNNDTQVLRFTEFQHDELGRQVSQRVRTTGEISQTHYQYDELNRLTQLSDGQNTLLFRYDKVGRLTEQRQWQMNDSGFANSQVISYQYDKNGNRTKLTLPNKDEIRYFYYGSGHLSAIKYNDSLITEISRDKLHQEISRSQGALTSQFKHDALGRLTQQLATLESASKRATTNEHIVRRNYQYDRVGNLTEIEDLRTGKTPYRYDKLGQIQLAGQERFAFDPAHNLIERESERIQTNQVTAYQGIHYQYDEFGNLSQRTFPNGEVQTYHYNAKDKLIKAIIQKPNQAIETWQYQYDVLGRRIGKVRLENGEILAESQVEFIWDGSHLVQEIEHKTDRTFTYIYSHPSSYEPLAQLVFAKGNEKPTACYYYHNDQIGIPRELTDEEGKVCWYGSYTGWGKLKESYQANDTIHQPFRLQNQYCDQETGLHYNFFRYYEPNIGRFTQLDPIGLAGGVNLYWFAENVQGGIDPLGLARFCTRPLSVLPMGTDLDASYRGGLDLGIFHEHIFFDDGTNIGYTTTGVFSETSNAGYKCSNIHYNDDLMKKAVENVRTRKVTLYKSTKEMIKKREVFEFGDEEYNFILNNCQDFATEVEKEYWRLSK